MNGLERTIEVLNDIVTEDDTEEKERQEALAYLESLKPVVPNEVANWYSNITYWSAPIILKAYNDKESGMPEIVRQWIDRLGITRDIVLYDISRFGYRKEKVIRFVIKTACNMLMANDYYVIKKDDQAYQLTTDINKATKFTLAELNQVPETLQIGWTIKKVYV